jgi:hypothetical protein
MEWEVILALAIGILVILSPVAFVWYINIGGVFKRGRAEELFEKTLPNLTCSVDTDCPPGYVCLGGRCMPQKA